MTSESEVAAMPKAEPQKQTGGERVGLNVQTPECDRLLAVADDSHKIGDFLDWLRQQGIRLCRYGSDDNLYPISDGIELLLARYYGIDTAKVEDERAALLDAYRQRVYGAESERKE